MGLLGAMSAVGTALGPALGGLLIETVGWRGLFATGVPLTLLTIAAGMLLLVGTLAAYALALTLGHEFGSRNGGLLAVAGLGLVAFIWRETHASAPLIQLSLYMLAGRAGRAW